MDRITITLPEQMKSYVESRVSDGSFGNTSEYIRDLVRHDQERIAFDQVEALVLEGIDSGPGKPWKKGDFDKIRAELRRKYGKKRSPR